MIDTETLFYKFKIYTELGENATVHLPLSVALECADAIKERDAKILQLEKEADWLAWNCETLSGHNPILRQGMSKKQWREAAREAVEDASNNS